jgi:hypothetical protein
LKSKLEYYELVEYIIPNLLTSKEYQDIIPNLLTSIEYQQTSLFRTKEKCIYAMQVEEENKSKEKCIYASYGKVMY